MAIETSIIAGSETNYLQGGQQMSIAIEQTIQVLQVIVQTVPVGTNLALLHLLWSMLQGSFLVSRGAIFPAMQHSGFNEDESRRSWAAMRHGVWSVNSMILTWRTHVSNGSEWQRHVYDGIAPVAVDWTTFWRFRLRGRVGKYFNQVANRALKGISFGLVADVGQIGQQRIPLLRQVIRTQKDNLSEAQLKADTLKWVAHHLDEDEAAVVDAGAKITDMEVAGIERYVLRVAQNITARRNELPAYKGRGCRPKWGERIRPFARKWKDKLIPATQPDHSGQFLFQGRDIVVHSWQQLVLPTCQPSKDNHTFAIYAFFDPLFKTPLILATNLAISAEAVFQLYLDRWPVEQIPLASKQMLGLHRQFVFAPASRHRLPELALLAGNVLTYLAAILPAMPTGFWDRHPKKRRDAYGAFWGMPIFRKITHFLRNFAKRSRSQSIYRRGLRPIDDKNSRKDSFFAYLGVCLTSC